MNTILFLITSVSLLLRMKNVSDKICRENGNTHFMLNNVPPLRKKKSCPSCDNVEKGCKVG